MLDFFYSSPPDYPSAEVERMNRELLDRLALRNPARESLVTADRNPACDKVTVAPYPGVVLRPKAL